MLKLADLGVRAPRWTDAYGVVHGWYIETHIAVLERVTFCGKWLFTQAELDEMDSRLAARIVNVSDELYNDIPVTCLTCMNNGALDQ